MNVIEHKKELANDLFYKTMSRVFEEAQVPQKIHLQVLEQLAKRIKQHEEDNKKHLALVEAYRQKLEEFEVANGKDGKDGKDADEKIIIDKVLSKIPKPKDGRDADEEVIIRALASKIRQPKDGRDADEARVVQLVLDRFPTLKEGQEGAAEVDIEVLTKKVLASIQAAKGQKGKSIGLQHIEGLEERLKAMQLVAQQKRNGFSFNGQFYRFEELMRGAGGGGSLNPQTPVGTVNGVNVTFTITGTLNALFVNGQFMTPGGVDYTLSGTTITFVTAPPTTSVLYAI